MPSSGLYLRGVPVERLHQFAKADAASAGFALAQAEFDRLRGPRTPLLQDPPPAPRGPAPHLRALITDLLVAAAGGPRAELEGEDALLTYAELRLALIESLAGFLAGFSERAIPPSPVTPTATLPTRAFTALARPRPDWLNELAGRSFVRVAGVAPAPPLEVAVSPGEPPPLYVARASAAWRAEPTLGAEEVGLARRRADRLTTAGGAPLAFPIPPAPPPAPRPPVEDVVLARSALAARAASHGAAPPQPGNLTALVLDRFVTPPTPSGGRDGFVVAPESAASVLAEHDVMVSYVLQPL